MESPDQILFYLRLGNNFPRYILSKKIGGIYLVQKILYTYYYDLGSSSEIIKLLMEIKNLLPYYHFTPITEELLDYFTQWFQNETYPIVCFEDHCYIPKPIALLPQIELEKRLRLMFGLIDPPVLRKGIDILTTYLKRRGFRIKKLEEEFEEILQL
jgi:hypothetical protein